MSDIFYDIRNLTEEECIKKWTDEKVPAQQFNRCDSYWIPLTTLVFKNWSNAVLFLIKIGVDIDNRDSYGDTALAQCVNEMNMPMMKLLLDNGADIKAHNWLVLRKALWMNNIDIVKYLINDIHINKAKELLIKSSTPWHPDIRMMRFLHIEQIRIATMVFTDLPQYIILWITDWLPGSDCLSEYEKVSFIERIQASVRKVKKIE